MCPPLWRAYERVHAAASISYAAKGHLPVAARTMS
jgi:hypothetical protein